MRTPLVRRGVDEFLIKRARRVAGFDVETVINEGHPGHVGIVVYSEMLVQICRDFPSLPDPRTLTLQEIRWFYNGLRGELRHATAPRKS